MDKKQSSLSLIGALDTHIEYELVDDKGNVVLRKQGRNAETIWAKVHAPLPSGWSLYFDVVTVPPEEVLGDDPQQKVLTAVDTVQYLRSYIFSGLQFSYNSSEKEYTVQFSTVNKSSETTKIYGMLSFAMSGSQVYLYTLYIFSTPVDLKPGYIFGGKYRIKVTPNTTAPSVTDVSVSGSDYTGSNALLKNLSLGSVTPEIRMYKYSRYQSKSHEYFSLDETDTTNSFVRVEQTSSTNSENKVTVSCGTGELYYKCLLGGGPGGARAVRYLRFYDQEYDYVSETSKFHVQVDSQWNWYGTRVLCTEAKSNATIRPWKFSFPVDYNSITDMSHYTHTLGPTMFPLTVLPGEETAYWIGYLYWPSSPALYLVFTYFGKYEDWFKGIYINGQRMNTTVVKESNYFAAVEVDCSSLESGEGIVVVVIHTKPSDVHNLREFFICGDFYGYAIPYVGFLEEGSSEIVDNWVTSHFFGYGSGNVKLDEVFSDGADAIAQGASVVQGVPLDQLRELVGTEYCYWVWVKESEFDKVAGTVGSGLVDKLFCSMNYYNSTSIYAWSNRRAANISVPQIYGTEGDFVFLRTLGIRAYQQDYYVMSGSTQDAVLSVLFDHSVDCDHYKIDYSTREFELRTAKLFTCCVPQRFNGEKDIWRDSMNRTECILFLRKQGEERYTALVPESLLDYTEGSATVEFGGIVYEVETTVEQTEHLQNLSIQFSSDTVFAQGEYFCIPVCDGTTRLIVDKFESWHVDVIDNVQSTEVSPAPTVDCFGMDRIAEVDSRVIDYTEFKDIRELETNLPNSELLPDKNVTHYFVYTVTVHSVPGGNLCDKLKQVLLVPKRFEINGEVYYTNAESFVVTDGSRVIPHNLLTGVENFAVNYSVENKLFEDYWLVGLNTLTLYELFQPGDPNRSSPVTVPLFLYTEAKKKEDILPLDIDLYTYYARPFGSNDVYTRVYIIEAQDKAFGKYAYNNAIDIHNVSVVSVDANSMEFLGDGYISVEGLHVGTETKYKSGFVLPRSHGFDNWTVDIYFKPTVFPSSEEETQILLDTRKVDSNKLYGFALAVRETGTLEFVYQSGVSVDEDTMYSKHYLITDVRLVSPELRLNEWHYIVLTNNKGYLTLYLNGVAIGTIVLPSFDDMYNFVVGARYDKNACYLKGRIRWIHLSRCLRWRNEHLPPPVESDWDHVDDWSDTAVPEGKAIFKVVLPYSIDNQIDVVDEDNQHVDYAFLTSIFNDVSDGKVGNYLYIKCPEIKYSEGDEFVGYSQFPSQLYRYRINSFACFTAGNIRKVTTAPHTSLSEYFGSGIGLTCYMNTTWLLRNDLEIIDKQFVHCPYDVSPTFEPILKQPKPQLYRFKVVSSSQSNHTSADSFFPVYVRPPNHLTQCMDLNYNDSYCVSDVSFHTANTVHIFEKSAYYNCCEFIISEGTISGSVGDVYTSDTVLKRFKGKLLFNTPGIFTTAETMPTTVGVAVSPNVCLAFKGDLQVLLGYRALLSATTNYDYLLSSVVEHVESFPDCSPVYEHPVSEVPIQLSPTIDYLPVTASDASRDIALWSVDEGSYSGKLVTYTVNAFQTLVPCYSNYAGVQPFVAQGKSSKYSVVFTSFSKGIWQHNPNYIFTQDPDFVSLFNSGMLKIPGSAGGNVGDTDQLILPPDTEYVSQFTGSVVLELAALTNSYALPNQIYPNPYVRPTKAYTVWNKPARLREHFCCPNKRITPLYPIVTLYKDGDFGIATRSILEVFSKQSAFVGIELNSYPQFYYHDLDTVFSFYETFTVDYGFSDKFTTPTFSRRTSGTLGHYAAYADARIFGQKSIDYNVLWDPQEHFITKVKSFGQYTVVGTTDIGAVDIFPVLKLFNTSTSEVKYFMISRSKYIPEEVPSYYFTEDYLSKQSMREGIAEQYAPVTTFEMFDSLLQEFGANWKFQYGWLFTVSGIGYGTETHCIIRAITVTPSFTDISEYHTVPYCYYNENVDIYTADEHDLLPSGSYKVKVYNTADNAQSNVVVRIDLSEIDLSSFTQGVVLYMGAAPLPTIYEYKDGYLGNDWNRFLTDKTDKVYVKLPTIEGKQSVELTVMNAVNTYTPDEVFDKYFEFGDVLDTSMWHIVTENHVYTGSVHDTDAGVGATSTTDRLVFSPEVDYLHASKETYFFSNSVAILRYTDSFNSDKLYEMGYSMNAGIFASVFLSSSVDSITDVQVEVPHYTYTDDECAGSVAVRLPDMTTGYRLYVYYDTGSDTSSKDAVFESSPIYWNTSDAYLVKKLRYWYETGSFTVDGNNYSQRLVIELAVDHPFSGDRIVDLPIVKLIGTRNFKIYRQKTAHDYFNDAKFILQLKDKFVASKLPSTHTEWVDKSKYAVKIGDTIDLELSFAPYGLYYRMDNSNSGGVDFCDAAIELHPNPDSRYVVSNTLRAVAPSLYALASYYYYYSNEYCYQVYLFRRGTIYTPGVYTTYCVEQHDGVSCSCHTPNTCFGAHPLWRSRQSGPLLFSTGTVSSFPSVNYCNYSPVFSQVTQRIQPGTSNSSYSTLYMPSLDSMGWKRLKATNKYTKYCIVQPLHLLGRRLLSTRQLNSDDVTINLAVKGACTHMGFMYTRSYSFDGRIEMIKTHESDYIYPTPDLETPIVGFAVDTNTTYIRLQPTDVTNWVVEQWETYYSDIKVDSTSGLYIHIAVSTGNLGSFRMKWFRVSQKPTAPIVQLKRSDLKIVFPNLHGTWYAFVRNESPVKSVEAVVQHKNQVLTRNRSLPVSPVVEFMSAVEQCRGIGTQWLPPKWMLTQSTFYFNT